MGSAPELSSPSVYQFAFLVVDANGFASDAAFVYGVGHIDVAVLVEGEAMGVAKEHVFRRREPVVDDFVGVVTFSGDRELAHVNLFLSESSEERGSSKPGSSLNSGLEKGAAGQLCRFHDTVVLFRLPKVVWTQSQVMLFRGNDADRLRFQ